MPALKTIAAVTILAASALPQAALADTSITQRVANGVGRIIAAQGNAALVQIREELKDKWLQPRVPARPGDRPASPEHPGQTPDRVQAR